MGGFRTQSVHAVDSFETVIFCILVEMKGKSLLDRVLTSYRLDAHSSLTVSGSRGGGADD